MDALETFQHSIYQWLLIKKFKIFRSYIMNALICVPFATRKEAKDMEDKETEKEAGGNVIVYCN